MALVSQRLTEIGIGKNTKPLTLQKLYPQILRFLCQQVRVFHAVNAQSFLRADIKTKNWRVLSAEQANYRYGQINDGDVYFGW